MTFPSKVAAFLRQPTTVLGLSALAGTASALLTGAMTWQGAIPAVAGAIAAIALPDNTGAQTAVRGAAAAAVEAAEQLAGPHSGTTLVIPPAPGAAPVGN